MSALLQVLLGLFVLGILVLVHETGHFAFAKLYKVKVVAFSFGFGRPLVRVQLGETEYRICAIPFGGYVQMAGEQPEEDRTAAPDEFPVKPIWQRAVIAVAGPAANYVSAVAFIWLALVIGTNVPLYLDSTRVGDVVDGSPAQQMGIVPGDTIVVMNGRQVRSWSQIEDAFGRFDTENALTVRHGGDERTLQLPSMVVDKGGIPKYPTAGLLPAAPAVAGKIVENSPAAKAGMQPGDSIVSVNGRPILSWFEFSRVVADWDTSKGPVTLLLMRRMSPVTMSVVPMFNAQLNRYLVGINMPDLPTRIERVGMLRAVPEAFQRSADMVVFIGNTLKQLASQRISPKQLAGPVGIVQMSGGVALLGIVPILRFMALIGINLALFNLLPLIITDGGLLLFLLIEGVRGRPLPIRYQIAINRVAIMLFVALFVYVTFNDILRIPQMFRLTR